MRGSSCGHNQGLIYMSRSSVGSGRVARGLTVRVFISKSEVIALVWCSIFPGRAQPCRTSEIRLARRKAAGFPQSGAAKPLNVKLTDGDYAKKGHFLAQKQL